MTYPVAIVFCALCALAGFCFWAWLKDNEAQRLGAWANVVEQLTTRVSALDKEQLRMADHYGNALQKHELASESVTELADRLGALEVRVTGEVRA